MYVVLPTFTVNQSIDVYVASTVTAKVVSHVIRLSPISWRAIIGIQFVPICPSLSLLPSSAIACLREHPLRRTQGA
jgi:hypothetical protein